MAATSIALQLKALKSLVKADSDIPKRPITKPSLLFDPKQAADIDLDTIFNISRTGLEALTIIDERFEHHKSTLFSEKSKERDIELLDIKENNHINGMIRSYLRLLSGHLQSPSAFKTLEYLVRRYKVHVYNIEELILCTLPYHDTHAFVRVVQLIDFVNSRWGFLEGVKASGAPPPREVIIQQCARDMGILEAICTYATPAKKSLPSVPVIRFCTAVVVELLGSIPNVDGDVVYRILPFLDSGLKSGNDCSENKSGALMIVGLLANKVTLSPKLVGHLTQLVAKLVQADTHASRDIHVVQMSLMGLVTIVQSQSLGEIPKKVVDYLKEIGDLAEILSLLTKRFNIDRFLTLVLDSLIDYSHSDSQCKLALMSIIETVDIGTFIRGVVFKLLSACLRFSHNAPESGFWAKEVLLLLNKKCSKEFRTCVREFLEEKEAQRKGTTISRIDSLCKFLDRCLNPSVGFSDSRIWFSLEHPKAEIRRSALSNLDLSAVLSGAGVGSQGFVSIQDAVARCLSDSDLKVVRSALAIDKLHEVIDSAPLLDMLRTLLHRCTQILWSDAVREYQVACEIAVLCLNHLVLFLRDGNDLLEEIASVIFPLLVVFRRTRSLNLKALESAKEVKWPLYTDLIHVPELQKDPKDIKKEGNKALTAINKATLQCLANVFSANTNDFMPWLVKCCGEFHLSKTISFLVLLQSLSMENNASRSPSTFHEACFSFLKSEWVALEQSGKILSEHAFGLENLDAEMNKILEEIDGFNLIELNLRILVLVFWRLIKQHISSMSPDVVSMSDDDTDKGIRILRDLYVFFAESNSKHLFKEHRRHVVENSKTSPIRFLSVFITEEGVSSAVQVESLHSFTILCSRADVALGLELLAEFPLILISLSSDDHDVRTAAMSYAENLSNLCDRVTLSDEKNASGETWSPVVSELLRLLVQQKKFVLSDRNFLPSFLAFILSPSFTSLVVPQDAGQRFEKHAIDIALAFIMEYVMKLSGYAKLRIFTLLKELGGAIVLEDVEVLLCKLLQRRRSYNSGSHNSSLELSTIDIDVLCLLIEICSATRSSNLRVFEDRILPLLWIDGVMPQNDAVIRPCVTFLHNLNDNLYTSLSSKMQLNLFKNLVLLYHDANADVQIATRDAILRLSVSCSTLVHMLNSILASGLNSVDSSQQKKRKSDKHNLEISFGSHGDTLSFLSSLLDLLLLKKDIQNRSLVIEPLFALVRKAFSNEWVRSVGSEELVQSSSGISQTTSHVLCYIQQTLLLILEDIISSLTDDTSSRLDKIDAALLVECVRSTEDVVTRNHVYSLFATIARVKPDKVLNQIPDICAVIGQSTVTQNDSHSNRVLELFISAVVPCWLSNTGDANELLQIFLNVMPDVASQRRLSIVLHLLKTLGEKSSMGSLLVLLFHSLASKDIYSSFLDDDTGVSESITSVAQSEWEFSFGTQLCEQYSCMIWLPSLVSLLKQLQKDDGDRKQFLLLFALKFIMEKLQDPELVFKLQAMEDIEVIQGILSELMVQVVSCWRLCDLSRKKTSLQVRLKKEFEELVHGVLVKIRKGMLPSAFFRGINGLLVEEGKGAKRKALQVLCETVRETDVLKSKREKRPNVRLTKSWLHLEGSDLDSFDTLCMEILRLLDNPHDDVDVAVKLAAISALEALARKFPSNHTVFGKCLSSVMKLVISDDVAVGSCCLRTVGALINVLGPRALPELPQLMTNVLKRTSDALSSAENDSGNHGSKDSIMLSVLITLEALVENLGAFLNPYLEDIIELMVSHPDYISESNQKLKSKADIVRKLITDKVALRIALPALRKVYPKAVKLGDVSVCVVFELLKDFVGKMDKSSVNGYYTKIFDLCIVALDLRSQRVGSIKDISVVEKHVVDAVIALTMKMTETMFRPLFVRSIEWAELKFEEDDVTDGRNIGRALSFYGLIEKLAENHRSLFVPYFKYLIDASVRYLTAEDGKVAGNIRKKKKAKVDISESKKDANDATSLEKWHLRALIISSLHKCFLYDTGSVKFLDSSRFNLMLKPIVSQLVIEPPRSLEEHPEIPSVIEVDDVLVSCISQMAVTSGSDLFWKPLNYEVLMQTRSDMVRSRLLSLRIIKRLVENLKEEYLVLLAETIPFLAELLEDVELPVKTLAQEILKEMEALSGENLHQYF